MHDVGRAARAIAGGGEYPRRHGGHGERPLARLAAARDHQCRAAERHAKGDLEVDLAGET